MYIQIMYVQLISKRYNNLEIFEKSVAQKLII